MSHPAPRLPARPSLEQLRKQAKELLRRYRAGDPAAAERFRAHAHATAEPDLAAAQFTLARELGFDSWPKLVRHVEAVNPSSRIAQFENLARDILLAARGEEEALQRFSAFTGTSYSLEQLRAQVVERLGTLQGAGDRIEALTTDDARHLVARQYGFEDWGRLAESLARPPDDPHAAPRGLTSSPPFYRIDWSSGTLEVRPPLSDKDWELIAGVMQDTGLTGLSAGGQMTDAALQRVARLGAVTRLDLDGSQRLSDDGLQHLAAMPQLEELDLSGWHSPLTDRGLVVLRHLPGLRRLAMCWPQRITDAGLTSLAACERLESVNLLGTPTGDGVIAALAGKDYLRSLKTGRQVTDAGLPLLHRIPAFKSWQGGVPTYSLMSPDAGPTHLLVDGSFSDRGFAALAGLEGLFGLSLFWHATSLTPAALAVLAELPNLGFLGCEGRLCDDEAMRHIGALPQLRMLMAQGTVADDEGFTALSRSRTLEYIWGRECPNLADRGFAALATMPALRGLAVSCRNVGDEALGALPDFPALRELMPMDVQDDGFRHVGRCRRLEALWCMYCRETGDTATGHIAGLTGLRRYYAGKTRITDRSLEILGGMPSLEVLQFWEIAGITNAGLAALARLPRLREVSIEGATGVTRDAVAIFPDTVRVNYR